MEIQEYTNQSAAPEGYQATTPEVRSQWNGFLDYLGQQGLSGHPNLDNHDFGVNQMQQYKNLNPKFSVTPEMIPSIQFEHDQLRNGDSFSSLTPDQTVALRSGLTNSFLSRPVDTNGKFNSGLSKLYYPQTSSMGTDIEGFMAGKMPAKPIEAPAPTTVAPLPITGEKTPTAPAPPPNRIPLPDYNDPKSRMNYLTQWGKKYGDLQGRGDTIMKINEVPRTGSDTAGKIAQKIGNKFGVDPALLHASAMEEGASELFKDKSGLDTKHRKPGEFGYMGDYGDKEFPVNGANSMGLPDFANRFPELVKGGYLPKSFADKFRGKDRAGEFGENNFKTVDDAMTAKAALMKFGYDYVDKVAKKNGVELSPKARDFFTLAWFNGGEGAVLKRIPQYAKRGYLKDDKFIEKRPVEEEGKPANLDVWGHVSRRISMAENIKKEGLIQ